MTTSAFKRVAIIQVDFKFRVGMGDVLRSVSTWPARPWCLEQIHTLPSPGLNSVDQRSKQVR